jgi:DNA-binding Lrp family transcriptional regulator
MTDAFVNVDAEGDVPGVVDAIEEIEGVAAAHHVLGEYDVVVELALEDPKSLQRVVTGEIRAVEGVTDTTTVVTPDLADHQKPEAGRITPDG